MSWLGLWECGNVEEYAQLYLMICALELLRGALWCHSQSFDLAKSIDLDIVKREDRSFLSICGNNDFIVIAIEIEKVAITKIAI
jgi:hypothetical protein